MESAPPDVIEPFELLGDELASLCLGGRLSHGPWSHQAPTFIATF
jgi:hypothetical protein